VIQSFGWIIAYKASLKKIIMSNSQPNKIIRDKIEKSNSTKKKYIDLKIKKIKFDTKI